MEASYAKIRAVVDSATGETLPSITCIENAVKALPKTLPRDGLGDAATEAHLLNDLSSGFNGPKTSPNYYGFVTGGVFPIAEVADNIVTAFDQNVQVHLPHQTISTTVEDLALSMLVKLLNLGEGWEGKTFTTGATGANILGLACGRQSVIEQRLEISNVGELGLLAACAKAGVNEIQVVTTSGHSSLYKAASIVGLGRASVKDISPDKNEPWRMDLGALESALQAGNSVASIVSISAGEVNTGRFATEDGLSTIKEIRALCDKYKAWLHVDAAFGLFARALPKSAEFESLIASASGLELADSITGDAHKMLNVPYDCGFFLCKSLATMTSVFQNPNAAYLSTGVSDVPSPLNIGIENSRRFRALPVYAVLLSHGSSGLAEMFARQVRLARGVAEFLDGHEKYELLAQPSDAPSSNKYGKTHIIILFRARDEQRNSELVNKINGSRTIYVSGTKWEDKPACRIAISTWKVDVQRDLKLITEILSGALE